MITLQCKLTPKDYLNAQYLHLRPRPLFKYLLIVLGIVYILGIISIIFWGNGSAELFLFLAFGVYGLLWYFVLLPWRTRRTFNQQKTLHDEYQAVISADMIEFSSENGTHRIHLSKFYKYKVSQELILVYQSARLFHMFARRWFASEEDYKLFISYLRSHLGKPKG